MDQKLASYLICPFCGGDIKVHKTLAEKEGELDYGLLGCSNCKSFFPVVESIPIMIASEKELRVFSQIQKKRNNETGIIVAEISDLLQKGDIERVRRKVVYSIPYKQNTYPTGVLPDFIEKIAGDIGKKVVRKILYSSYFDSYWSNKLEKVIGSQKTTISDVMHLYYQSYELSNYFFYKFGQPRFLALLDLVSTIDSSDKPILDIACGQGHLMHFLTHEYTRCLSIGLDRNFYQLFLAKKYIAPKGQYVCAEADEKLAFKEGTFNSVICSDAFHYFRNKVSCIRDIKNILQKNGSIIISRAGNQYVTPNEAYELSPEGYIKLFSPMPATMFNEDELLACYLEKKKPDLGRKKDTSRFNNKKWISVFATNDKSKFKEYGSFDHWPHALGELGINPLYKKTKVDDTGNGRYRFSYPSSWYKFENSKWQTYAPEVATIPNATIRSLKNNERTPDLDKFIDEFVILGFPKRYLNQEVWGDTEV